MTFVLGVIALALTAGNDLYYEGDIRCLVPGSLGAVLVVVLVAYAKIRGTFR